MYFFSSICLNASSRAASKAPSSLYFPVDGFTAGAADPVTRHHQQDIAAARTGFLVGPNHPSAVALQSSPEMLSDPLKIRRIHKGHHQTDDLPSLVQPPVTAENAVPHTAGKQD